MARSLSDFRKELVTDTARRLSPLMLILLMAVSLLSAPVTAGEMPRAITVLGEGRVAAVPDMAVVGIGIGARSKNATEALAHTSETMADIIAALRAAGVEPTDIQTSGLNLRPLHDRSSSGNYADQPDGFEASNRLSVRIRDLARVGNILDILVREKGANRIDGVRFALSDPAPLQDDARRKAIADARARAELYAQSAGVALGPVLSIEEHGGGAPMPMADAAFASARAAVPVEAGEIMVSQSVTVRFAIE